YCITDVRLITFRSAIFERSVRISSCTPSVKKALSGSRLRFSKGKTAIVFSGTAAAVVTGVAAGTAVVPLPLATGAERRDNRNPPRASAATINTAAAITQLLPRLG